MRRIGQRLGAVVLVLCLCASPLVVAGALRPTPIDWRHLRFQGGTGRIDALAGREAEIRERDQAWNRGRTEMEFLPQYEQLGTDRHCYRYAPSDCGASADAQALANATGEPVDVIVE